MLNQSISEFLSGEPREHVKIMPTKTFGGVTQQIGRALRQGKTVEVVDDLPKINRYIDSNMSAESLMDSIRAARTPRYYFDSSYPDGVVGQYASRAVPMYCIDDMNWLKQYDGQVVALSYDHYTKITQGCKVSPCYLSQRLNSEMSKYRIHFDHDGDLNFVDPDNGRIMATTAVNDFKVVRGSWLIVPPDYVDKVNQCFKGRAWGAEKYNERVRLAGKDK